MKNNTPFIHLLRSPYNCYFYDVNTDDIVMITEETYNHLNLVVNGSKDENTVTAEAVWAELAKLTDTGYLSCKRPQKIENPQIEGVVTLLSHGIQKITLQVTQSCNFRCVYCEFTEGIQNRRHSPKSMSWDVAKKAIDFLAARIRDSRFVDVGFYGGEPLLELDLVKRVIDYAEIVLEGKKYSFSMTTNGSLLSLDIAKYLLSRNVNVMISLDGPKENHDRNRVFAADGSGTYETIWRNIDAIKSELPEFYEKISFNSVIDPACDYQCTKSFFRAFPEMNFQTPMMSPQPGTVLHITEGFLEAYKNEQLLGLLYMQGAVEHRDISPISANYAAGFKNTMKEFHRRQELPDRIGHSGPCMPGVMRLFVDTEGYLFPCERVSESSEAMKIGHIDQGFILDKVTELLNVAKLTEDACKDCWAITHCKTCAKYADDGKCLSAQMVYKNCPSVKSSVENDMRSLIALEETKEAFRKHKKKDLDNIGGGAL